MSTVRCIPCVETNGVQSAPYPTELPPDFELPPPLVAQLTLPPPDQAPQPQHTQPREREPLLMEEYYPSKRWEESRLRERALSQSKQA
jgi:hypothetical protein